MANATQQQADGLSDLHSDVQSGRAREIRERSGLTQADIAACIGVTRAAVSLWEAGTRMPSGAAATRYARFLAVLEAR